MQRAQIVRCPNCGSLAQRHFLNDEQLAHRCPGNQILQTECPVCDYLMVMCSLNGSVIEAYAPGRKFQQIFLTAEAVDLNELLTALTIQLQ